MTATAPVSGLLAALSTDVPVDPDADQARRWLEAELLDPVYHHSPSLLERLLAWVQEQIANIGPALARVDPLVAGSVVVGVAVLVAVVALLVAGPVRRSRGTERGSHEVLADETRSAAELRSAADTHAAAGRLDAAVLDRFRALLRSLEERAVLDPRPGRTAHEAAEAGAVRFPERAADLRAAGRLFDDVCYGDSHADGAGYRWIAGLDDEIARTRPDARTLEVAPA
ncbi:DUF4129 domain-containing protein [Isoptericola sp. b441]|uniref:DUF4129 domain-containing protein n=1 Tax=Actinotalea lenta TaxID=3064654 RepID=A0ABT9DCH8_9CELL|nr:MULTISPECIES: DUF4129 domain-containing protein [unclassified Isoptericola]MDO8108586.1 DUF4129 domain-containing protein [Isoptericola sp. b441]MDO8119996.1 DUF4129 domain-containing protein [Isoptericola sp. b490]